MFSIITAIIFLMQAQRVAPMQSSDLQSMLYQPGAKSRRVSAASYGSPAGSSGTYRASSQLLPLDLHPSDPFSVHDAPQQEPLNPPLTLPDPALGDPHSASLAQSRLMRESAEAHNSGGSVSAEETGSPGSQPGSQQQGVVGGAGTVGGQPNLDIAAICVVQV